MSLLSDIREQIRVRLATVPGVMVIDWDGMGQDVGPNSLAIGVPSTSFGMQGDPLGPDAAVGRWGWEHRWPLTLTVTRTTDRSSTVLLDGLMQEIAEALISDPRLSGTCLASALDSTGVDDTDPEAPVACHVVTWELVTVLHLNL